MPAGQPVLEIRLVVPRWWPERVVQGRALVFRDDRSSRWPAGMHRDA